MAKAAITKKYSLTANGILAISDEGVFVENTDTGELIDLRDLLSDFADKSIKFSITYDYDYDAENDD